MILCLKFIREINQKRAVSIRTAAIARALSNLPISNAHPDLAATLIFMWVNVWMDFNLISIYLYFAITCTPSQSNKLHIDGAF